MKKKLLIIIPLIIVVIIVLVLIMMKKTNKDLVVKLFDNSSMGYVWTYQVDKQGIVEITEKSDYSGCDGSEGGCAGKMIYTITPLKEGKVTITYEWIAPVHGNKLIANAIYTIEVDKDLNINETHTGSYFDTTYYKKYGQE